MACQIRRRGIVLGCLALLLGSAWSLTALAQPPGKVPHIGYISPGASTEPARQRRLDAFRQGLRALGYVEGQNVVVEPRWAQGHYERYPALAAELVHAKVDVIVTVGGAATQAAQRATATIPIVMTVVIDPLGGGLVSNLARPEANVTGLSLIPLVGKQLEVLKEVVPKVSRVAILANPGNPATASQLREAETAARTLGMRLRAVEARAPGEIEGAFSTMTGDRALLILPDGVFTNQVRQIAALAVKNHLPSIYGLAEYAEAGGLMVYSPSTTELERRAATYVDKILKGARPADLPVEQPSKLDLVINLKTARALGLTIPPALLLRADQVIK